MKIEQVLEDHIHHFLTDLKAEGKKDEEAGRIIAAYIRTGAISAGQEHILKTQVYDSLKILGVGIPFLLIPGASILIPILIKVAARHKIELLPSAFNDQAGNHISGDQ